MVWMCDGVKFEDVEGEKNQLVVEVIEIYVIKQFEDVDSSGIDVIVWKNVREYVVSYIVFYGDVFFLVFNVGFEVFVGKVFSCIL